MKLWSTSRFCWNCKSDQSEVGPPSWKEANARKEDSSRVEGVIVKSLPIPASSCASTYSNSAQPGLNHQKKLMSFEDFVKNKTSKTALPPRKKTQFDAQENVTLNIGLKVINGDTLKTIWGKRLPLLVPKDATYSLTCEKAVAKWSDFDCAFDSTQTYVLTYDDGREAQFMPGGYKDFFSLQEYKKELGKEYKRITLYLCPDVDCKKVNGIEIDDIEVCTFDAASDIPEIIIHDNFCLPNCTPLSGSEVANENAHSATATENMLEKDMDWFPNTGLQISPKADIPLIETVANTSEQHLTVDNLFKSLEAKVDKEKVLLVLRRGAPLYRVVKLWQRQSLSLSPTRSRCIQFSGEQGIDTSAISREFLERTMDSIKKEIFPNGTPQMSTYLIQNGTFRSCGEIAAVGLVQHGLPLCFLRQ